MSYPILKLQQSNQAAVQGAFATFTPTSTYIDFMRYNAQAIAAALGEAP